MSPPTLTPSDLHAEREGNGAPIDVFRQQADDATRHSGLDPDRRSELIGEMVDHLAETWEAERRRGSSPEAACSAALSSFGRAESVRRGLTLERLLSDLRRAARFPRLLVALLVVDAAVGSVLRARTFGGVEYLDLLRVAANAFVLHCGGAALVRFGWQQCQYGLTNRITALESFAGAGFIALGIGSILYLGPGWLFPALCDVIDALAGRDVPISLVAISGGLTAGVLGLLGGAWFRSVGAR